MSIIKNYISENRNFVGFYLLWFLLHLFFLLAFSSGVFRSVNWYKGISDFFPFNSFYNTSGTLILLRKYDITEFLFYIIAPIILYISFSLFTFNKVSVSVLQNKSSLFNSSIVPHQKFSYYQPIYHLVILSIVSFGSYLIYWFYRNWNHIKIHKNLSIRPWLRTLGLFVPVLNLFLLGEQFYYVKTLKEEAQIEKSFSPGWNLFTFIFIALLSSLFENFLKSEKDESFLFYSFCLFLLFGLFSFSPFIVVQRILNLYWIKVQPEFIKRTRFSIGEIVFIVIALLFWLLILFNSYRNNKSVVPEMVYIPAGEFMMGSNDYDREKPLHRVKVDAFYIGKYEVTQREWITVMGSNPSYFQGDDLPVEQVSWFDAQNYLQKLSSMTGKRWRLPTEAEWEYACRAGSTTKYCFGDNSSQLYEYAWYSDNSDTLSHPVGKKKPNAWGLYDMYGNVFEWCQDWYSPNYYANSPLINPDGPSSDSLRVVRSGCFGWPESAIQISSAYRNCTVPTLRNDALGFRCVREP